MRAAVAKELSGIDRVELGDRPEPVPGPGQVLIRVRGAGVGPWDVGFLGGGFPGLALPFVPGQEVAGVVEAVGPGADDCSGGQTRDQAIGAVRDGGRVVSIVLAGPPMPLGRGITGDAFAARVTRPRLEALRPLVDAGTLRSQIETVLSLEQARQALAQVAGGHTRGKVVLQIGQ